MKRRDLCLLALGLCLFAVGCAAAPGVGADMQGRDAESAKQLRVAVAQIPVAKDVDANVETILRAIDRAAAEKAEVLLTPEGSLSGYHSKFDPAKVREALKRVVARASAANLALALGTCFVEPEDGKCYNQVRFYDAGGNFLGFHSKILRTGSMSGKKGGEVDRYSESPLRTFQIKGVTVGALICNDMWANPCCTPMPDPHLSQQLAGMGAKVIFHAVNGGRNGGDWSRNVFWPFHETSMRIRARSGKVWIVTVDNCHPENIPCSAPSGVIKPDGYWAVRTPDKGEQMVVYTIELQ